MGDFITYMPRNEYEAAEQVRRFIAYCRDELTIFADRDPSFDWSANAWDITRTQPRTGKNKKNRIPWTRWAGSKFAGEPMTHPFGDFARSYCRHLYGEESNAKAGIPAFKHFDSQLLVLRLIEQALIDLSPDGEARIERMTGAVLDRTVELAGNHYIPTQRHSIGSSLGKLYRFLKRKRLIAEEDDWSNPFPPYRRGLTDNEIKSLRNNKLPSEAAILALSEIFATAETPVDKIISSVGWIMASAPQRAAEISDLWIDSECWREHPDRKELVLRWYPVKNGVPQIKPVPEALTPVVEEALRRLREMSEEARAMARWYEANPDRLYLPPRLAHLRGKMWLSNDEVVELLGFTCKNTVQRVNTLTKRKTGKAAFPGVRDPNYLANRPKGRGKRGAPPYIYRFSDIETYLIGLLPDSYRAIDKEDFAVASKTTGMKYSQCMLIFPYGTFGKNLQASPCVFEKIDSDTISGHIGPCTKTRKNIFARHNKLDADGNPLFIKTHMFRHWLTTMGEGVMTPIENNQWAGRAKSTHIDAYLHNTADDLAKLLGRDPKASISNRQDEFSEIVPFDQSEAEREISLRRTLGHPTEFGWCSNDYSQEPCNYFQRCLKCPEHICVVGDEKRCQRIEDCLRLERVMLDNALEDFGENFDGTDRWVEYKRANIERLSCLVGILRDPTLPIGTVVRMRDAVPSPFQIAAQKRAELTGDPLDCRLAELVAPKKSLEA